MSIHVCMCKHGNEWEFHLRYPRLSEDAAQRIADRINAGALTQADELATLRAELESAISFIRILGEETESGGDRNQTLKSVREMRAENEALQAAMAEYSQDIVKAILGHCALNQHEENYRNSIARSVRSWTIPSLERGREIVRDAALYHELLMQVGNKYPGETRHQTALRYLQRAEVGDTQTKQAAIDAAREAKS